MNHYQRPGLKALIDVAGLKKVLHVSDLVFGISPRINAAGRIEHAHNAVKLLLCETDEEATLCAKALQINNTTRKEIDKSITDEALALIRAEQHTPKFATVLCKPHWHKGVIGIVASRCIEHFYKPTIIFTENKEYYTGSARSVDGFDLYKAIEKCDELIAQWGGHTHAAGLSVKKELFEDFKNKFEEVVKQDILPHQLYAKVNVDAVIQLSQINLKFYNIIQQMEPFGPGNRQPIFESRAVFNHNSPRILKEQHLKLSITQDKKNCFDAIGFGLGYLHPLVASGDPFDICYQISLNEYMGNISIQLLIKDIKAVQ
jgi:single-stranded-DNA-specific exonuclease